MNAANPLGVLLQDVRYSLRVLRKSPGFTLVAALSLMLGIGANSAVFSVIQAVLLRPLPFPEPARLVRVAQPGDFNDISLFELQFWKEHAGMFDSSAGYTGSGDVTFSTGSSPQWITASRVSTDFFRTLGVPLAAGREFNTAETVRNGAKSVILTDAIWRNSFNSDPAILGRTARIGSGTYTVIGVLPASFWFTPASDVFLPLQPSGTVGDGGTNFKMIARLKAGLSLEQARAQLPAVGAAYLREHPTFPKNYHKFLAIAPFQEVLTGDIRLNLLLLFGAVALLLLIACFNVASLMMARLSARQKEIAMRLALGSGRTRLFRQFLIENLLVTLAGGVIGLAAASALLKATVALVPFNLHSAAPISLDTSVLAFALAIACLTAVAMSALPIVAARRLDVQEALKSGGRGSSVGLRTRARNLLVIAQVALSVTMLVSAGLLIQSLYRLYSESLGFRPTGLIAVATTIPGERRASPEKLVQFQTEMLTRLLSLPGVQSAAGTNEVPLSGWSNFPTQREGHPESSIGGMEIRTITPAYLDIMGVPVRSGRGFAETDTATAPPVMLVNETLARRWWGGSNPLGDRVIIGRFQGRDVAKPTTFAVVGVVADTKTSFLKDPPLPTVYIPAAQDGGNFFTSPTWVLRAAATPGLIAELRRAILSVDTGQRIGAIRTMDDVVASTTAGSRFNAWLFASLAGLALVLTIIGIYGLLAFSVARRTNEIGTRMALGASRFSVLLLILRQGLSLIVCGLAVGLAGAFFVTRYIQSLLYVVKPTDPLSFAAVSILLIGCGLLASYLPARRATRIDPMAALRDE